MRLTLYKLITNDDKQFYCNDRREIINYLNNKNQAVDGWEPYTLNRINGVIYNNSSKNNDIKSLNRYYVNDYYKDYIDKYIIELLKKKHYTDKSLNRVRNQYVMFINGLEVSMRNNGLSDDDIKNRLTQTITYF
tara:strand:+ start:1404 stop:1805 length:402 start_codon:yes stop_codon:yes gene_type:complete